MYPAAARQAANAIHPRPKRERRPNRSEQHSGLSLLAVTDFESCRNRSHENRINPRRSACDEQQARATLLTAAFLPLRAVNRPLSSTEALSAGTSSALWRHLYGCGHVGAP